MDRGKRDRQSGRGRAEPEGRTDSESTSFDGSFRDKSEAGLLEKLGSTATMEFSSESAGGESFQERFEGFREQQERSTEERNVRARLDSPKSGFPHSIDLDEHLVKPRSVRPSGGKDRHSKVQTSKGLRDRRVRLSVATAIQFYDVQDRLGYDQPSKAVEWLLKNAKAAIDELPTAPAAAGRQSSLPGVSAFSPPAAGSSSAQTSMPAAVLGSTTFPGGFYPHIGLLHSSSSSILKDPDQGEKQQAHAAPNLLEPSTLREGEFGKVDSMAKVESRVKARERARERVKEKTTGRDGGMNPPSPPHSSQQSFSSSQRSLGSSFDSSILGAHESPAYTSFTSLLQSPMHTGASQVPFQNLVQTLPPPHMQLSHLQSLYHSSIQNQFIGPQHSFQQALLQASLEPKHFPAPFPQASYAAGLGTPLSVSEYHPYSAAAPAAGSQAVSLSQLAALGIFPSSSLVGSFHSESPYVSSSLSSSFRPSTPSSMLDDSYLQGLLRPQFSFPYSNLPNVATPQFEALPPASSYPHHFVSLLDRNTPGQREFRVFPPVYPNVYQSSSQLPGVIQGLDDEIEELKHRSSSPPPRPP